MADTGSSSLEKKQNSAEEQIAWKRELPRKYLADEDLWNDDDFMPKGASMEHRDLFRKIYSRYFRQICETDGFDIDIYPGEAKAATYIPYLDLEEKTDMLMELANHAIQEYNNKETSVYKYEVLCIEKVNFIWAECREFFLTVKVNNLTLRTPLETFQIHAYKGPHEENIVRLCRQKVLK
ncbi:uncharacterized protein LOC107801028 [Nicotiana tabacum]|uniref:Uncharacterized protein LOC107801028 n=3 Tax=Nicotiana TaxID=4085 RepID=A0AC58TIF1_TOBAC|nr:PREDICTED: uncharacterized protein LOC104241808 [Nicotiana sylvestris]XP_016479778.1 PREDICTED: uncharacterized protein LOC107801028 [Nicotiana tabacum]